jgi:hypothetical protein
MYRMLTNNAVMIVLVEASNTSEMLKAQELWDLIDSVYANNPDLLNLAEDRRRSHAAEQIVAAWTTHPDRSTELRPPKFMQDMTRRLAALRVDPDLANRHPSDNVDVSETVLEEFDFGLEFDMDLGDIDWSFWSSVD